MPKLFILFLVIGIPVKVFSQKKSEDTLKIYSTAFKININGIRVGIEQKIAKRTTIQFEAAYLGSDYILLNPQVRYYPAFFKNSLSYLAVGYMYKDQEYNVNDSIKIIGTSQNYKKDFYISKFIHAITLNYGILYERKLFKQKILWEFSIGIGARFKKSNRYGLLPNEEVDLKDDYIMHQQQVQDTNGKFKTYPELNLMVTFILPLIK